MEDRQQDPDQITPWGKDIELYKVSRGEVQYYGNSRWKRLATYLTSTALLFTGLAFAEEKLGVPMCITIAAIGFLYTLCFLVIEYRAGKTLRSWVDESHRLERILGGQNKHSKVHVAPSQEFSFRMMYVLFVFGWAAVGVIFILK